jgi:membrane-associated protein
MPILSLIFSHALELAVRFKYPLIFWGAVIEGPILTVASGFLLHQGAFDLFLLYLTLVAGDLLGDVGWYYIGYFFAEPVVRKHGRFLGVTPELFEKVKIIFHKKHSAILFVSKITMGFGMALGTLMAAGAVKIPLKIFIFYNALGEFVYVGILMLLGYYFGSFYSEIASGFKLLSVFAILVISGAVFYGFSYYIRTNILKKL